MHSTALLDWIFLIHYVFESWLTLGIQYSCRGYRYVSKRRMKKTRWSKSKRQTNVWRSAVGDADDTGLASLKQATILTVDEQLILIVTVVPWGHRPCFYLKIWRGPGHCTHFHRLLRISCQRYVYSRPLREKLQLCPPIIVESVKVASLISCWLMHHNLPTWGLPTSRQFIGRQSMVSPSKGNFHQKALKWVKNPAKRSKIHEIKNQTSNSDQQLL